MTDKTFIDKNQISYLEMARLAMACIPDDIMEEMDINDNQYIKLRDGLIEYLDNTEDNPIFEFTLVRKCLTFERWKVRIKAPSLSEAVSRWAIDDIDGENIEIDDHPYDEEVEWNEDVKLEHDGKTVWAWNAEV